MNTHNSGLDGRVLDLAGRGGAGQGQEKFFSSPKRPTQMSSPTRATNSTGTVGSFSWDKAARPPSTRAEVRNEWCYTSTLPIRLHGM